MEQEYCDYCGRKCDGVHSIKVNNKEKVIQKSLLYKVLEIEGCSEKVIDEIIKQIYENQHLKCKKE